MALVNERARLLENDCVGPNLYCMKVESPLIAAAIKPGQFVHMKVPHMQLHLLRRPFSLYARDERAGTLDIVYQVVGYGSQRMAKLVAGHCPAIELIGPVGNTWQPAPHTKKALLVGGGVGAAPLFMLCEWLKDKKVDTQVILGAHTADALCCKGRFETLLDHEVTCSTDDGSFGREGFCTTLVQELLEQAVHEGHPFTYVAVCGPEPLMRIVAHQAAQYGTACQVSLERRMACGIGACLSCVVDTTEGKRRACVDGPIFDAHKVVW